MKRVNFMSKNGHGKKQPHSPHQTQWAAQFAVASELCKRGYQVALTMGNHPVIDLMVVSPKGTHFIVDVKGLHKGPNFWRMREKEEKQQLFYVFALVPSDTDKPNQFFVLTQRQANEGIRTDWKEAVARRKAKGRSGDPADVTGVTWKYAEQHNGDWKALPE